MSIDINNDKIQGITIQDTSIHTRVATLGILWRSEDVDIRWNNMIVMAAAISRGIDSDRVIKDYSNYPLGLVKTYDDKNPKPDLAAKIITSVTERSAKFYPSHYNRTMSIYVDWTNEAKKLTKENGTIKYNNIIAFGEPVIRTIDPNAEQMNPHIDDVIGYAGEDDNQLSRIYMIGSAKGKQGLFYIERAQFQSPSIDHFIYVGKFNKKYNSIALAFDGYWELVDQIQNDDIEKIDNYTGYRFITEDLIWFIQTIGYKLYAQKGLWGSSILLAEDAVEVVAERGQNPRNQDSDKTDQGIIVAQKSTSGIIKFLTQTKLALNAAPSWLKDVELKGLPKLKPKENEDDPDEYVNIDDPNIKDEDKYEILYTREKPLHIQIHRLNDYIIGLEVSFKKDGKNQTIWHLTDRTYGSMGFPPEVFNIPTIYLNLFYMGQQTNGDTAEMQPILTWYYDNNITITVSSDYEYKIYDNLDLKKVFSVSIGVVKIVDVRLINNRSLQILLEKPAEADFQIKLTSNVRFASYLTDEFRKNYVMIKTQTHDFEAAIKLDNKEYFNIPIIYLNNFKIEIKPVEKIYYNETETFEIPIIYLNKLNIKVNLLEQKQYYYNENDIFKIPIIYLDEIRFEVKPYGLDPV